MCLFFIMNWGDDTISGETRMARRLEMLIRVANKSDAKEAYWVLRRSIKELCSADHHDDARTMEKWLRNKITENVLKWMVVPDQCF